MVYERGITSVSHESLPQLVRARIVFLAAYASLRARRRNAVAGVATHVHNVLRARVIYRF